ncbi:MAG: amidohydrolase family protein [Chloroflexi bacterium]|nr:amidohydrolase family protein [Chloroflexota bacterium]
MIIDADCHISSRQAPGQMGVDDLLRQMDALGVDRAVCWPMVAYDREMASDMRTIYDGAQRHPDRVIPFGGVNPKLGLQEAQDELKRCIEVYGVKGVKLNGARDGYYIDDPKLSLPLVDMIAEAGIALAFHCGSNDFERTHPYRIAKISRRHPDLPIMIVHMGGSGRPSITDAVIDLAREHPTWYLIDSEADYRQVLAAVQALGADRICYGSDTPFCPMRFEFGLRGVVYQDLSPAERANVMGGNIAHMLGTES